MSPLELISSVLDYRAEVVLWVLASIGIYTVAANLLHFLHHRSSSRLGRMVAGVEAWPHSLWFFGALKFIYYLCVPYVALTRGVTNPTVMGLWSRDWFQPQWFQDVGQGSVIGLGTVVLLIWGWRQYLQATAETEYKPERRPFETERRSLAVPWGWGLVLLEVLYLEMHWAFYRGAAIRLLGDYYGAFLGFVVVLAEWWLSPEIRRDLGMAHRGGETMTTAAIALSIAITFYFTANLWLCIAIHVGIRFGLLCFLIVYRGLPDYEGQGD